MSWPDVSAHFGALDIAGFEKDRAGFYRAAWRAEPSIYLSPQDWTAPVPIGSPIRIYAFTAAPYAEAWVNGASLGKIVVGAFAYADWGTVPFAPGNLTAAALDGSGGVLASTTVLSVGPPVALRVTLEAAGGARPYAADGGDVALLRAEVVDAQGAVVPWAAHAITFTVEGEGDVYGVGNGDPADHVPDKVGRPDLNFGGVWWKKAFHGLARAFVQTRAGAAGSIKVTAAAEGLVNGSATFVSQ